MIIDHDQVWNAWFWETGKQLMEMQRNRQGWARLDMA